MNTVTAYIGIGANLGDATAAVRQAIADLSRLRDTHMSGQSSLFRSAPVDADGDDFINAVLRIETALTAGELLTALQTLEQAAGRERSYVNAPRTLDLDLLLYGQQQIRAEHLQVPHPRMTQRAFVLIPLLQIDPAIVIPGSGAAHTWIPQVAQQQIQRISE